MFSRAAVPFALVVLVALGCGPRKPQESMTAGHAVIGAADAVFDLAWFLSREFQAGNQAAFIDIRRAPVRSLVDSLLNGAAEEIFLDRKQSPLAVQKEKDDVGRFGGRPGFGFRA